MNKKIIRSINVTILLCEYVIKLDKGKNHGSGAEYLFSLKKVLGSIYFKGLQVVGRKNPLENCYWLD